MAEPTGPNLPVMVVSSVHGPVSPRLKIPVPAVTSATASSFLTSPMTFERQFSPIHTAALVAPGRLYRLTCGLSTAGAKAQLTLAVSLYSVDTLLGSSPASE